MNRLWKLPSVSAAAVSLLWMTAFAHVVPAAPDEGAEIKLLVQQDKIAEAMATLKLAATAEKNYRIYFVDTADFKLNRAGVILRLRDKGKKKPETETTVKFRPENQSKAPKLKLSKPEKETEWLIGKGQSLSYAVKNEIPGTKYLKSPGANLKKIFSGQQKTFFKEVTGKDFDRTKLKVFGPIPAEIWEWSETAIDTEVSAERWKLGNQQIFELSRKTKPDGLKKKAKAFEKAFKGKGISVDSNPESKTRKALEYYSTRS